MPISKHDSYNVSIVRGMAYKHTTIHPSERNRLLGLMLEDRDNFVSLIIQSRDAIEERLAKSHDESLRLLLLELNAALGDRPAPIASNLIQVSA